MNQHDGDEPIRHDEVKSNEQNPQPVYVRTTWAKVVERIGLRSITAIVFLVVFLAVSYLVWYVVKLPENAAIGTREAVGEAAAGFRDGALELVEGFRKGTIVTEFKSSNVKASGLQWFVVGKLATEERFTKSSESTTLFGYVSLPTIVKEIEIPVEFTYYVDFRDEWNFHIDDELRKITVEAPAIELDTPAPDFSGVRYLRDDTSYFRTEEHLVMSELKEMVTEMLIERGQENTPLIREIARKEVTEFVRNWFVSKYFEPATVPSVEIVFSDEITASPTELDKATEELSESEVS